MVFTFPTKPCLFKEFSAPTTGLVVAQLIFPPARYPGGYEAAKNDLSTFEPYILFKLVHVGISAAYAADIPIGKTFGRSSGAI